MEEDVKTEKKTRKRTKCAITGVRVKHGDSSSARVDDGPTDLTSFGMIAEPFLMAPE